MTQHDRSSTPQASTDEEPREQATRFPVTGAIPRIERQQSHYEFLWAVRPPAAMTNLVHARRMLMHDESAQDFFPPETTVLVTSTIPDEDLREFSFEEELRLVRQFDPDHYLPFDFPVYGDMDADTRAEHVRQVAAGTLDMDHVLSRLSAAEASRVANDLSLPRELVIGESDTGVLPLIKGTSRGERAVMERTARDVDAPLMAKYATQYMTVPGSGNYPALRDDLEAIYEETAGYPMLVVGLLSPSGRYSLEGLPNNVVAAAGGSQWRERVSPGSSTPEEMREAYHELATEVAEALKVPPRYDLDAAANSRDTPPGPLDTSPGNAATLGEGPAVAGCAGDTAYAWGGRKRPDDAISPIEARNRRGGGESSDAASKTENAGVTAEEVARTRRREATAEGGEPTGDGDGGV